MKHEYTELQLDALREVANVGAGTAGTALSSLLGRPVDIDVPTAGALALSDAVDAVGAAEAIVVAVVVPVMGDLTGAVLMLFSPRDAAHMCSLLGVEAGTEVGVSALQEVGNILAASYVNSMAAMTGMTIEPAPPHSAEDMLGALVESVLAATSAEADVALLLDSRLEIEGEDCDISFLLVPTAGSAAELLDRLGVG